jgi:hypothetical protein
MFGTIRRMPFGHLTWDSKVSRQKNTLTPANIPVRACIYPVRRWVRQLVTLI